MSVEVLLMANVADLGTEGDVVRVADGFARNYLLPKKLAAPVNEGTRRRLAKIQKDRDANRRQQVKAARALASQIEKNSFNIIAKVGEGEKMYGSVTTADIAATLKSSGIEVDKRQIQLENPIKELGVYDIEIKLDPEVTAVMKVWIVEE